MSQIQQLKREMAGGTNLPWDGVCSETILALQARAEKNKWKGEELLGVLSHDSTMVKDGVMTDHNNEIVGLDLTMPMDIVNQKMQAMVSCYLCRTLCFLFLLIECRMLSIPFRPINSVPKQMGPIQAQVISKLLSTRV